MTSPEIDFLKTILDGMASAQEQAISHEAHCIIKPFIRAIENRIVSIAGCKCCDANSGERCICVESGKYNSKPRW